MKRFLPMLLILCMIVSLFSGMAMAVEEDTAAEPAETLTEPAPAEEAEAAPAAEEAEIAEEAPAAEQAAEAAEAAAEEAAIEEAEEVEETTPESAFGAKLYIPAKPEAGLDGEVSVRFSLTGGTLYLPGKADESQLFFAWDDDSITVSKDDVTYTSGKAPVAPAGERVTYKVTGAHTVAYVTVKTVKGSAGVEPMFLQLDESLGTIDAMNSDEEHETRCFGKVLFDGNDNYVSIKGRGNSTWDFPKKPYNITLYKNDSYEKKEKVVYIPGVKKCNKYCLLANYLDNSLVRNKVAMDLANTLGIGLGTRYVDVWMNGEYLGNYLMTPKKDLNVKDGGFMIDNDHIPEDVDQFKIEGMHDMILKHNRINIEEIGDDLVEAGIGQEYIEAYVNEAFAALIDYDSENYLNYFDLDSWAKMFLMVEVSKTYDCYAGNFLMRRDGLDPEDKLIAGPAWDYDIAFGRTLHKFLVWQTEPMQLNAEGWFNDSVGAMIVDEPVSLLQELGKHESFMQAVARVYNEYKDAFEDLAANTDRQREALRDSAMMNNDLWGTHSLSADYLVAPNTMSLLGTGEYALHYDVTLTWDNYVNNVKEFCSKRVQWLSDHLWTETAEGSVVKKVLSDGTVVLQAVLTNGSQKDTYQWQMLGDDGVWADIEGATGARFRPETEEIGMEMYRCAVRHACAEIVTFHGGTMQTWSDTVLEPASVTVFETDAALEGGVLTMVVDNEEIGEYTFVPSGDGWTIRNSAGKYLRAAGYSVYWSDEPMVWRMENGGFVTTASLARTGLGWLITLGYERDVYLTADGGKLSISTKAGEDVTFRTTSVE